MVSSEHVAKTQHVVQMRPGAPMGVFRIFWLLEFGKHLAKDNNSGVRSSFPQHIIPGGIWYPQLQDSGEGFR